VNLFPCDLLGSSFEVLRNVALSNGFAMLKSVPPEVCLHARAFSFAESGQAKARCSETAVVK